MERTEIFDLMGALKLYGMRAAYDEVMAAGIKRECEPPRIVGDLLRAEIAEKQARSIKYQLTIAKLPLAKDIDDFRFDGTPINEALVRELATGAFIPLQRNVVLIGGTGTGKTQVSTATPGSGPRGRVAGDVCLNEVIADRARQSVRRLPGYSVGASQVEQGVKT